MDPITATFGDGTAPYQVKIDAGAYAAATSPKTFTGLAPGSHTITVKDANGCTKSNSITVASCPTFCSLTQGAYGNAGGKYTYNGVKYTTTAVTATTDIARQGRRAGGRRPWCAVADDPGRTQAIWP